jgi:lambda family phage portal protein
MCPYGLNQRAPNGNYIMNGIELDFMGARAAYWFYQTHPGDAPIEQSPVMMPVRVPASEVLHIFKCTRPGQMRGVPLVTPSLVRLFFLDQYDDAELERKRIAAMFAGFITTATPEDVIPIDDDQDTSAPQENVALAGLEPGTMQTLLPGEDIKFAEPADVGGSYEAYQYRQQLAVFSALGIPYSLCTSDLRRANYSSLRGSIVEYRRKLEQFQHNVFVFQMCAPIWRRWLDFAVLAQALPIDETLYVTNPVAYQRAKWIPQRNDWVDPLKDRQAEKLAVDSGFKSRSDVIEAEGYDPEENDLRIAADHAREDRLGLVFSPAQAPSPFGSSNGGADDPEEKEQVQQDAEDADTKDNAA